MLVTVNSSQSQIGKRAVGRTACLSPICATNEWLKTATLSAWLGLTAQALQGMRRNTIGPKFQRLSRTDVRYRYADVAAYLRSLVIDPASYRNKKGLGLPVPVKLQIDKRSIDLIEAAPGRCADDLFTPGQLCSWWGISGAFLERARHVGYGPKYIKISRNRVMYRREDLLQYLRTRAAAYVAEYTAAGVGQ